MNLLRYDAMVKRAGALRAGRGGGFPSFLPLSLPVSPWVLGLFLPFLARCRFFALPPRSVRKVASEEAVGNAEIVAKGSWEAGEEKGTDVLGGGLPAE